MHRVSDMSGHFQFHWSWTPYTQWAFLSIQFTYVNKYMYESRHGSRMLRYHVRSLVVRGYSPYETTWQTVLTGGLEQPIWQRTNTNLNARDLRISTHITLQDPNRMTTTVKWRHSVPTTSEDDEKTNTAGDERTSTALNETRKPVLP
jgi:hypothetical protein